MSGDKSRFNSASETPAEATPVDITDEIHDISSLPVGFGGYSEIRTGWYSPQEKSTAVIKVAIKVARVTPYDPGLEKLQRRLQREIRVWHQLWHPNIQTLCGTYSGIGPLPALVSPWCENGDINTFVEGKKLDPTIEARELARVKLRLLIDVMAGVEFLHAHRIVHGDIKGANILISDEGIPLLCDFGLSRIIAEHSESATQTGPNGTWRWMAPELCLVDGARPSYKSDIWACGCLFVEVWSSILPYHSKTNQQQFFLAVNAKEGPCAARPEHMPDFVWTQVKECCDFDAAWRPRPSHIRRSLAVGMRPYIVKFRSSIMIGTDVFSVAWFPDGVRVAVGCTRWGTAIVNLVTEWLQPLFGGFPDDTKDVAVSRNGKLGASCTDKGSVRLWDAEKRSAFGTSLVGHTSSVISVAFSPDGRYVVTGSEDGTIRLWCTGSCTTMLAPLCGHSSVVLSVSYSPNGSCIVSGSSDRTIRVWNAHTGRRTRTLRGHTDWVRAVAYSPDGLRIVSGSDDCTIRIWDAKTGHPVGIPLEGHSHRVLSVAYSPDGMHIASASGDHTIRIWDPANSGIAIVILHGHTDWVYSAAFSPDGKRLASASKDGTVRVWDAIGGWMGWDI